MKRQGVKRLTIRVINQSNPEPVPPGFVSHIRIINQGTRGGADPLDMWVKELRDRARNDFDNIIVGIGPRGRAKSTKAIELARRVDEAFRLDKQIAYLPEDILECGDNAEEYQAVLIDEAGEAANNKEFMSKQNKALVKAFTGNRFKHLTWIFLAPLLKNIESGLWQFSEYLFECKNRRTAIVYDLKIDSFDSKGLPYRYTKFRWDGRKLPEWVYNEYSVVKRSRGEARLKKYQKEIVSAQGGLDPEVVLEKILADPWDYLNKVGNVNSNEVALDYGHGLTNAQITGICQRASRVIRPKFLERERKRKEAATA